MFLITLPLVAVALIVGLWVLPWHAQEEVFTLDHLGGILSIVAVGSLVVAIETATTHMGLGWAILLISGIAATIVMPQSTTRACSVIVSPG